MSYAIEEIAPLIKEWTISTRLPEVIAEMTRRYYYRAVIEQSELSIQAEIYKCKNDPAHWFNHWVQWIGEKPMQWFEPKNDGRLIYRQDGGGTDREVDQFLKFFLTRRKATFEQPYGKALLATLYWLFFFKQNGFKFWAKFLERFGTPILLGKKPLQQIKVLRIARLQHKPICLILMFRLMPQAKPQLLNWVRSSRLQSRLSAL